MLKLEEIIVSEESYNSEDEYEIIYSNIDYLNSLFQEHVYTKKVSDDALKSYYVDYYLAQVNNGDFSQFVYNSGWEEDVIRFVREGLMEMGAIKNMELFNKSANILDEFGSERIEEYLSGEYFGSNKERDILDSFNDQFYELQESESLIQLNSQWLKRHDKLEVLNKAKYQERIKSVALSIPDRDSRLRKALDEEPRYMKLIRALCKASGQTLGRVTAGDPTNEYKGTKFLAWHFLTNVGHHYMIDYNGQAIMFRGETDETVATISAGEEYGPQ